MRPSEFIELIKGHMAELIWDAPDEVDCGPLIQSEALELMGFIAENTRAIGEWKGHEWADDILRLRLIALGEGELVALYDKVEKWYA